MSKLKDRATAMADLLELSAEIGASCEVRDQEGIYLVGPGDTPERKIGNSVSDAVRHLKSITVNARLYPRDGQQFS